MLALTCSIFPHILLSETKTTLEQPGRQFDHPPYLALYPPENGTALSSVPMEAFPGDHRTVFTATFFLQVL